MIRRLSVLLVLALGAMGCRALPIAPTAPVYGDRDRVIRRGRLKVYRISPATLKDKDLPAIHGHELLDGPEYPEGAAADRFRDLLLDPASYPQQPPAKVKVCRFEPAIVLRFTHNTDAVEVLVSFVCNRVKVYHNDKLLGMRDIDPGRNRLLTLARAVFPGDTYLDLMPPRRGRN